MPSAWDDMAVVGRVARVQGLRGEVIINPETDFPDERFQPGQEIWVQREEGPQRLRIRAVRFHRERPIVSFAGIDSLEQAASLTGADLRVSVNELTHLPAGTFYRHDLVGCRVVTAAGADVGIVTDLEGPFEASRLVVSRGGQRVLIPLVDEICTLVAPTERRIVITPPDGLIDLR